MKQTIYGPKPNKAMIQIKKEKKYHIKFQNFSL